MTFGVEKLEPLQRVYFKTNYLFCDFALKHDILFQPYREPNYELSYVIRVFMYRLHQNYETIMRMDSERRDELFLNALEDMRIEQQQNNSE